MDFKQLQLQKYKILLIFGILLGLLITAYFLTKLNTILLLGFTVSNNLVIFSILVIFIFLGLISWIERRIRGQGFLLIFAKKELYLLITSLILFIFVKLTTIGILPNIIMEFLSLTLIALFLTLNLSFLNNYFKRIDPRLSKISIFILIGLILAFIVIYTKVCFIRFNAGLSSVYDLGNMEQTVWNTLHGNFFRMTTSEEVSRLGYHSDIFLALLTPFYAIWQSPKMLLFIQALILGLGAWPLFLITKKLLKSSLAGLIFAFAYLISPILGAAALFDFHAVALVTPFLLFAFYFLLEKRYIPYLLFILLALTCKEEISLLVLAFGIYVYFKHNKKLGMITALFGLFWFIVAFFIIIPHFAGVAGNSYLLERFSYLGTNQKEIIITAINRPQLIIEHLWDINKLVYVFYPTLPFGCLMFFSSFTLIALPSFLLYIFSNYGAMFSGGYHYSMPLLFPLIIGSIFGIQFWLKRLKKYKLISIYSFLFFVFFSSLLFGFIFCFRTYGPQEYRFHIHGAIAKQNSNMQEVESIRKLVPSDASLSTSPGVGVYFTARKNIFTFPKINNAEFIILNQPGLSWTGMQEEDYKKEINNFFKNSNYQIAYEDEDFILFKRK